MRSPSTSFPRTGVSRPVFGAPERVAVTRTPSPTAASSLSSFEASSVRATAPVSPSSFQQGKIYLQHWTGSAYVYSQVSARQVPKGSIVYVNGMSSTGAKAAAYAQDIAKNNAGRDVYVVFNDTPATKVIELGKANWSPTSDHYAPIATVLSILKATGGDLTLMGHSMGEAINDDAALQYAASGGSLTKLYAYSWGGAGSAENLEAIVKAGAHATNFVHEEVDRKDASGKYVKVQPGDQWAGKLSYLVGGDNWATIDEDASGKVVDTRANDAHTIGIGYQPGVDPSADHGHDYSGQIGNTVGAFVTAVA